MQSKLPSLGRRDWMMAAAGLGLFSLAEAGAAKVKASPGSNDEEALRIVNRLIREVQSGGDFELFEELFDPAFVDHTPFPGYPATKDGARRIYHTFRDAFPDFRAEVKLQLVNEAKVVSFKTYSGTHLGPFMGLAPTGRRVAFPIMDIVEVKNGRITAHWGVPHVLELMSQLGVERLSDIKG